MKIQVRMKHVYGRVTVYPHCETARILCELSGCSTLTPNAIVLIKRLGYTVEVIQAVKEL